MADRVGARGRGCAAAVSDPAPQRPAGRSRRPGPPTARRVQGPPRVSIHRRQSPTGTPVGVDRARCSPTGRCTTRPRPARARPPRLAMARRVASAITSPPLLGVLDGAAVRARAGWRPARCSRQAMRAGERDQADLRPAGAEVDGEDEERPRGATGRSRSREAERWPARRGQASAGMDCWASIMSAMTARMNSSASSVMPPATPP